MIDARAPALPLLPRAPRLAGVARFAAAIAIAAAPRLARAEPPRDPVRFAWVRGQGADGCAGQERIAEQVTTRLGASPFSTGAARSIEAIVSRDQRGFRSVIYVRDASGTLVGTRELASEAERCASIEAATALAVAIAIDPDAALRPAAPPPVPAPAPPGLPALPGLTPITPPMEPLAPPTPSLSAAPPPPPAPLPAPREGLGTSGMSLRAGVGFGLLPRTGPAFSLGGHAAVGELVQITGEALWMPEARTADGRFGFGLAAFSAGACVTPIRFAVADFAVCGAMWVGALHAVVYDLVPATPGDYVWAGASAAPRIRLRLGPHVHFEVGAPLLVPVVRRLFAVEGWPDPVFQQPPVTLLLLGGLGANFP